MSLWFNLRADTEFGFGGSKRRSKTSQSVALAECLHAPVGETKLLGAGRISSTRPLRAVPVFDAPMFACCALSTTRLGIGIPGLIGKNNVVVDGNVLPGIVRFEAARRG